jgi:carbon monoxide dehydrogenase subunit G
MKVEGAISVAAPREHVFERISDAEFFASCIDGVSELMNQGAGRFAATFTTRVAFMRFTFKVQVNMTRRDPPSDIEARVEGNPIGIVGRLTANARTTLSQQNDGTLIRYIVNAALTGKLGSIGEPVLRTKAREMERQFSERLRAAFAGDTGIAHDTV